MDVTSVIKLLLMSGFNYQTRHWVWSYACIFSVGPYFLNKIHCPVSFYSVLLCNSSNCTVAFPDSKFLRPTRGPPGSWRPQMGPMLAPWTLVSGCNSRGSSSSSGGSNRSSSSSSSNSSSSISSNVVVLVVVVVVVMVVMMVEVAVVSRFPKICAQGSRLAVCRRC